MTTTSTTKKWTDDTVAVLTEVVGTASPVSAALVTEAAERIGTSTRSVAAKLRKLGFEVASLAVAKEAAFTEAQSAELANFVRENANQLTYKQIAENFSAKYPDGKFTAKVVQGKILALELTGLVRPADKVEAVRQYSADEEATFISMANAGSFIEDIATALNKSLNSVRGKALSLSRAGSIKTIPTQKTSHAKVEEDKVDALSKEKLETMTVADLVALTGKTDRGVKTMLTRRGIKVSDYDGASKAAKTKLQKQQLN